MLRSTGLRPVLAYELLEREPRYQRTVAGLGGAGETGGQRVHEAKAGSSVAVGLSGLRRLEVAGAGVAPVCAVEYVVELDPHVERHPLFNTPGPAEVHIL